jgi:exopolyphosphatase/guanosine-5'-triphosphate,3'-diphosphate pyrophosphatase
MPPMPATTEPTASAAAFDPGAPLVAVDLGSNSFRVEIAQLDGGRYRRLDYVKQTVRLGGGLDADGMLTEPAMQRGFDCLTAFAQRIRSVAPGIGPEHVRAVATQTLREAGNRDAFLQRAQAALGHPIEVISGREEARLIYAGVMKMQPSDEARLVVDIGGRSTEMIIGQGRLPETTESFAVGCVSLSQRFFPSGELTGRGFRAAQVAAGAELEEALVSFPRHRWDTALGSSGTAGAVAQVLQAARVTDGRITPAGVRWMIERCIAAGHVDRLDFPGLKSERRAVIPGGLAVLYTLLANFRIEEMFPARGALRQGVVVDLHERLSAATHPQRGDMRDATVRALQQRFDVDVAQAERVQAVALALFDGAVPQPSPAEVEARRELAWACALHEIGLMVSHHDHHRHSAYLLAHADAAGFSQSQQRRIGALVLGQRGGLKKIEAALSQPLFAWQVLCLRLAVIKAHARGAVDSREMALRAWGREARLAYSQSWAESRPRTIFLLQEEAQAWARSGVLKLVLPG